MMVALVVWGLDKSQLQVKALAHGKVDMRWESSNQLQATTSESFDP